MTWDLVIIFADRKELEDLCTAKLIAWLYPSWIADNKIIIKMNDMPFFVHLDS